MNWPLILNHAITWFFIIGPIICLVVVLVKWRNHRKRMNEIQASIDYWKTHGRGR